jgi:hypothetical protein
MEEGVNYLTVVRVFYVLNLLASATAKLASAKHHRITDLFSSSHRLP